MTSGEIAHRTLSRADHGYGRRCIHITWAARGAVDVSALGLECVSTARNADFILAHGTQGLGAQDGTVAERSLAELKDLLRACGEEGRARGVPLPLLLANPDVVTVSGCTLLLRCPACVRMQKSYMIHALARASTRCTPAATLCSCITWGCPCSQAMAARVCRRAESLLHQRGAPRGCSIRMCGRRARAPSLP